MATGSVGGIHVGTVIEPRQIRLPPNVHNWSMAMKFIHERSHLLYNGRKNIDQSYFGHTDRNDQSIATGVAGSLKLKLQKRIILYEFWAPIL